MPPTISNVAAAPSFPSTTAAALSKDLSSPSSFLPSSSFINSFPSSSSSSISPSSPTISSVALDAPPQPTTINDRLDPRSFFWPSFTSWPASYGGGSFYSYYCPPGVTYFGCRTPVPATAPVASATAVGPPPPPPPPVSTTAESSATPVPTPATTPVVEQTSVTHTTEVVTSPVTDMISTATMSAQSAGSTETLIIMSGTSTGLSAIPTSSGSSSASDRNSSLTNRTTVVILSSVLSVVGIVAVAGLVFICCRYRQRRGGSFFPRGISPIDDEEIETWKGARDLPETEASENEKGPSEPFGVPTGGNNGPDSPPLLSAGALGAGATVQRREPSRPRAESFPERCASLDSSAIFNGGAAALDAKPIPPPKKTLSNVIIYKDPPQRYPGMPGSASSTTGFPPISGMPVAPAATAAGAAAINYLQQQQQNVPLYRRSEEFSPRSTRSMSFGYPASRGMAGRFSFDQDRDYLFSQALASPSSPPTALQHARAPNSRAGLTDEAVPGDPSFLPTPKRQPSRLLKMPPATGSPSATAAATAATAAAATCDAGIIFSPRRNSHSAGGSSNNPSPPGNSSTASNSNSAAYWHARTRSARSCSTVSYAGSEVPLNQSFGQMPHQRRPSVVQYQSMYRPQILTPPQQSPTSILHQQLPVPPLPVSLRPSLGNGGSENISRRSSHSMYHEYLHPGKQPREVSSASTLASSSSASSSLVPPRVFSSGETAAAGASDDNDSPLLGGLSPPRPHIADSPPVVHERRSSSLEHLKTIGRAIG